MDNTTGNPPASKMSAPKKSETAKRKLRGFRVRFADNGGAIVSHDMEQGGDMGYQPDPEHVFSTPAEVHAHIKSIYPAGFEPMAKRANVQEPGEQA